MPKVDARTAIRAHLEVMRPFAWLWFDALPVAALYLLLDPTGPVWSRLGLVIVICICFDSAATTLNDVFDRESDRRSSEPNRNQRPLVLGLITPRAATVQAGVLFLVGLVFAASMGTAVTLAALLTMTMAITYSTPPFSFNARPWSSNLFWYVCGVSLYLLVAAAAGRWWTAPGLLWLGGYLGFFANGENMAKDLRDWDNDTQAGKVTAVVGKGPRRATLHSYLGGGIGIVAYVALAWSAPGLSWPFGVLVTVVLAAWAVRLTALVRTLFAAYDKAVARDLHMGYVRVFLVVHLLIAVGAALGR